MTQTTATPPAHYRYRLEFLAGKGRRIHYVPLDSADFVRAVESAFFDGLCRGVFPSYDPPLGRARIEPLFPPARSESPGAAGFAVVLPTSAGGEHRVSFESRFFHSQVTRTAGDLVRQGRLANLSVLAYQLTAYLEDEPVPTWLGPSWTSVVRAASRTKLPGAWYPGRSSLLRPLRERCKL